jgi:nicotinamidase-related amidase
MDINLDPRRTALLCMDCQTAIVRIYGGEQQAAFLERASAALKAARAAGMPVIYIQVGFRPGLPEVSPRNKLFAAVKASPDWQKMFQGDAANIHPSLAPEGDDIVVTKHRVSAFPGTDLQMILQANGIESLVLFGIATSGVVLSTLVDAIDLDYNVTVLSDLCADMDAELHTTLLTKYFNRRGDVITTDEFLSGRYDMYLRL